MRQYLLPGERIDSLQTFYVVLGEVINGPGGYFGSNLDALRDCLRGGFGTPDTFQVRWRCSERSRACMGHLDMVRELEARLAECHPDNVRSVTAALEQARRGEGPTTFNWIVDLFEEAENVELSLE